MFKIRREGFLISFLRDRFEFGIRVVEILAQRYDRVVYCGNELVASASAVPFGNLPSVVVANVGPRSLKRPR